MIRTITIEREYGAGGAVIAERLAQRLGWKLRDKTLTAEIARLAKVDQACVERMAERCDSAFYRLMKVFMRGSYERSLPVTGLDAFDSDSMMALMQRVLEQAADEGKCVIVGRGSPYYLRQREDAFHVFIYAPHDEKLTLGIPIVRGRTFTRMEGEKEANVAVVSEAAAQRFWRGQDPIGKRAKLDMDFRANGWSSKRSASQRRSAAQISRGLIPAIFIFQPA